MVSLEGEEGDGRKRMGDGQGLCVWGVLSKLIKGREMRS